MSFSCNMKEGYSCLQHTSHCILLWFCMLLQYVQKSENAIDAHMVLPRKSYVRGFIHANLGTIELIPVLNYHSCRNKTIEWGSKTILCVTRENTPQNVSRC